jgi:hypothetical protein
MVDNSHFKIKWRFWVCIPLVINSIAGHHCWLLQTMELALFHGLPNPTRKHIG